MITISDAKTIARTLAGQAGLTHSQLLEAMAHAAGHRDWNTFVAQAEEPAVGPSRQDVIPILRMFDHSLARTIYCDYLGFDWMWQHQFEADFPIYAEVAKDGGRLHLSEHHGDATPGGAVMMAVDNVRGYREQLLAVGHRNARPGIEDNPWGPTMTIVDPFGNQLRFYQPTAVSV